MLFLVAVPDAELGRGSVGEGQVDLLCGVRARWGSQQRRLRLSALCCASGGGVWPHTGRPRERVDTTGSATGRCRRGGRGQAHLVRTTATPLGPSRPARARQAHRAACVVSEVAVEMELGDPDNREGSPDSAEFSPVQAEAYAHSMPSLLSASSCSAVSLSRLALVLLYQIPSLFSVPSGRTSTALRGTARPAPSRSTH